MKKLLIIILLLTSCGKNMLFQPSQEALDYINETAADIHTINDVKVFMLRFVPDEDLALLEPTIYMAFANDFHGDCKTAAVMAEWACKQIGYNTAIVDLWEGKPRKSVGHRIVIAWCTVNEWHLFSNNQYALILSGDWRRPVIEYFKGRYTQIEGDNYANARQN